MDSSRSLALPVHVIGLFFWVAGLMAIAAALVERDAQADDGTKTRFGVLARKVGMIADLGATLAIAGGLWLILIAPSYYLHQPWMHMKLTAVVLGMFGLHGFLRARGKRASLAQAGPFPPAASVALALVVVVIVALAIMKPLAR